MSTNKENGITNKIQEQGNLYTIIIIIIIIIITNQN
jgi:hypothetical protein